MFSNNTRASSLPTACEYCVEEPTHEDSVPDARLEGCTPSECGYRRILLCDFHARQRRKINTSRVKELQRADDRRQA